MEQERKPRQRTFKGAVAAFNDTFSAVPCVVQDLSETGARIAFQEFWNVPTQFTLFIEVDGYKIECERVWQKGNKCGVHFTSDKMSTGHFRKQVIDVYNPLVEEVRKLREEQRVQELHRLKDIYQTDEPSEQEEPEVNYGFGKRGLRKK